MDRQHIPRGVSRAGLLGAFILAFVAVLSAVAPAYAAAPSPSPSPSPAPVVKWAQITGDGLTEAIVVSNADNAPLYNTLDIDLGWIAKSNRFMNQAGTEKLGPKYTIVFHVDGKPKQKYDLYPQAEGGPLAFRPAVQPGTKKKVAQGWFYVVLNLPATLQRAGVPLVDVPPPLPGGRGGGAGAPEATDPATDIQGLVGDWQRFVGLNFAVVLVIGFGLFVIAYLVRRKT